MDSSQLDIQNKIGLIDTHFQNMYLDVASCLKQLERTRIKAERMASRLKDYAAIETAGMKAAFQTLSECLQSIEDRRKEMYDRIEIKMYQGLALYETHCRDARTVLSTKNAADKTCAQKEKEATTIAAKYKGDYNKVSTAKSAHHRAVKDRQHACIQFAQHVEVFEKQKIRDLKSMWGDYIHAHIIFYSRGLEAMTKAQNIIMNINEDEEMESVLRATRAMVATVDKESENIINSPMADSPDPLRRSLRESFANSTSAISTMNSTLSSSSAPSTPIQRRNTTGGSLVESSAPSTPNIATPVMTRRGSVGSMGREYGGGNSNNNNSNSQQQSVGNFASSRDINTGPVSYGSGNTTPSGYGTGNTYNGGNSMYGGMGMSGSGNSVPTGYGGSNNTYNSGNSMYGGMGMGGSGNSVPSGYTNVNTGSGNSAYGGAGRGPSSGGLQRTGPIQQQQLQQQQEYEDEY